MTGVPDDVPALARVAIPDIEQQGYRAYPLVGHVADKIAATLQHYGTRQTPSTRFRDLVDLGAIVTSASIPAAEQLTALRSELERRAIQPPTRFDVEDRALWTPGYAAAATESLLPIAHTLDDALEVVRPSVEPPFTGTPAGRWNPATAAWED